MKRTLFIAGAILGLFLVLEAVCRVAFPGAVRTGLYMQFTNPHREQSGFIPDDALFWRLAPGNSAWEVNADGFRGPAVPKEKPAHEMRVVCLGDSCTFGLGATGVPYAETWCAKLQEWLAAARPGASVRALNFGCPGYTSFQGLRLLTSKAAAYSPDVVIAYFGINDGFEAVGFADKDQKPFEAQGRGPASLGALLRQSAFYSTLARLIVSARRALRAGDPPLERVSIEDYHRNLSAMAAFCKSIGAKIYFIAPPYLDEQGGLKREDHRIHQPSVDVMPFLEKAHHQGRAVIFPAPDNVHPTTDGHAAIAEAIAQRLISDDKR